MLGSQIVANVKVKLNRIDTNSYEDIRREEVIFFVNQALKSLTLEFDLGIYSRILNEPAIKVYLASLHKVQGEAALGANEAVLSTNVLKFKDVQVYVTVDGEAGWQVAVEADNNNTSARQDNPFRKSFPDKPKYRLIADKIKFDTDGTFTCTKYKYEYLKNPDEITLATDVSYIFIEELEDKTVTLILENLEAQRLQTQPSVSRS